MSTNPPAWHPDPTGRHDHRWWDGEQWTEHVADAGVASVDPLDTVDGDTGNLGGVARASTDPVSSDPADADPGDTVALGDATAGSASGGSSSAAQPSWEQQAPAGGQQPAWGQPAPGGAEAGAWGQPEAWQQQPAWQTAGQTTAQGGADGVAVGALVVGILSLLIAWIPFLGLLGLVGGLIALVLGFVGRSRIKKQGRGGNGLAIAGIVTGAIAIVLALASTIGFVSLFGGQFGEVFGSYAECVEETGDEQFCQQQLEDDLFGRLGSRVGG